MQPKDGQNSATLEVGSQSLAWAQRDVEVLWHGFTQMREYLNNSPTVIESAEGRELIDVDGRRYFDAISSLWVTTLGHALPELNAALAEQAAKVSHSTMLGNGNRVTIEFAEALAAKLPMDRPKSLFASDGAPAVEQALKIAFQYWHNLGETSRTNFLTLGGSYHGDTVGSLSLGDGGFGTELFDPLRFGVLRTPGYENPDAVGLAVEQIDARGEELAAVVIEPIVQGAAGIRTCEPASLAAIGEACERNGTLLICDEVAVGFGRTGTLFGSEQCGLRPDLMALGKGMSGGYLPFSATAANQRVFDAFLGEDLGEATFYHGHSYSGHALGSAVALRHLQLIDEWNVLDNVRSRSAQIATQKRRFESLPGVEEFRHAGMMVGVELAPPSDGLRWGRKVSAECVRRGVLIRPLGDVVVVVPPLTTTEEELSMVFDTLAESIEAVCGG